MATTHAQQREVRPTKQTFKGPNVTLAKSKNIISRLDIEQNINDVDLPGEHNCTEMVYVGILPTSATDYATSPAGQAKIGSICHYYAVTAKVITGYKQFHKVANAGATTDWKEVAYV